MAPDVSTTVAMAVKCGNFNMNIFRVAGDVSHTLSKCILIWAIHWNKSAEGVSLITQMLYVLVFCTRYLDIFWVPPYCSWWNFVLKNFYIWSSVYIILLMLRVYARTRERERAWQLGLYCLGGSVLLAFPVTLIFDGRKHIFGKYLLKHQLLWNFSIILESVCVLPQLLLLRQTTVPTVIDSYYLLALGSYRGFYIFNWIEQLVKHGVKKFQPGAVAVIFGIVQTALYLDFAWVYWTRQRVKLRAGGVVDSDDLRRGWLITKIFGAARVGNVTNDDEGDDEESAPALGGRSNNWGARGISVSADDGLTDPSQIKRTRVHPGASLARDDELRDILEDDEDEEDDDGILPEVGKGSAANGISNGEEWRG